MCTFYFIFFVNHVKVQYLCSYKYSHVLQVTDVGVIRWGNDLTSATYIPPDTPPCGFYNELCQSDNSKLLNTYILLTNDNSPILEYTSCLLRIIQFEVFFHIGSTGQGDQGRYHLTARPHQANDSLNIHLGSEGLKTHTKACGFAI